MLLRQMVLHACVPSFVRCVLVQLHGDATLSAPCAVSYKANEYMPRVFSKSLTTHPSAAAPLSCSQCAHAQHTGPSPHSDPQYRSRPLDHLHACPCPASGGFNGVAALVEHCNGVADRKSVV